MGHAGLCRALQLQFPQSLIFIFDKDWHFTSADLCVKVCMRLSSMVHVPASVGACEAGVVTTRADKVW